MSDISDFKIDKEFIIKFTKFAIVGAISFLINAGFTFIFYEMIHLNILISTIIALLLTQIFQFPMSKEWAFQYKEKTKLKQFIYFIGSRFASLLIITIVTEVGTTLFEIPWIFAQFFGVCLGMIFNFIAVNWFVFVPPVTIDEFKQRERQIKLITLTFLFLISTLIGIGIFTLNPVLTGQDNILWYLEAKIIIANHGLPLFNWFHTPLYQYLIAIFIIVFDDNLAYLKLFQIITYIICVCLVYLTIRIKKEHKIALLGSVFYLTSNIALLIATDVHQEGFAILFIILMFYFYFKYEEVKKPIFLYLGSLCFGLAFFTKETSIIVIGIYVAYIFLWIKPPKKNFIIALGIIGVFFGAFLVVDYLLDWHMLGTYLGFGETSDSFLSRNNTIEFERFFDLMLLELIPTILSVLYILTLIVKIIKDKKVGSEQILSFTIIIFFGILLISRAGISHFSYILFILCYIGSTGFFKIEAFLRIKILKNNKKINHSKIYFTILLLFPILFTHFILFFPNLPYIRTRNDKIISIYQEIGEDVGNEVTYSQIHSSIGFYIENYYSDHSWYNSYKRNNFLSWSESDVFPLVSMQNITDKGIRYFIFQENGVFETEFFKEIVNNGTLTYIKDYSFIEQSVLFLETDQNISFKLYEYIQ